MKVRYQKPNTECIYTYIRHQILQSSKIPIGGTGGFDVKQETDFDVWDDEDIDATEESYWTDI